MSYPDISIGRGILEAAWKQDKELTSQQLVKLAFIGNGFWRNTPWERYMRNGDATKIPNYLIEGYYREAYRRSKKEQKKVING